MERGLAHQLRERGREQAALPQDDGPVLVRESTLTSEPTSSMHGARMNTPRTGWSIPSTSTSASNESTCRP